MDKNSDQVGYLVLNEEGAVLSSAGELENDEKTADIIMSIITLTSQVDPKAFSAEERFKKLSITYDSHCYIVSLSNRKIHIVKKLVDTLNTSTSQDLTKDLIAVSA